MSLTDKMRQSGFTPSERALVADEYIANSSPSKHPNEWQFISGIGWTYVGPYAYYTSESEYTAWLNSQMTERPLADGNDAARAISANPGVPKGSGQFASGYDPTTAQAPRNTLGYTEQDVYRLYNQYLDRDPEAPGLAYWMGEAAKGATLADLEYNIANSSEALTGERQNQSGADTSSNTSGGQVAEGWYWASIGGAYQWLPVYPGESPLAGAPYVAGPNSPSGPPAGYDANGPTNNTGGDTGGTNNGTVDTTQPVGMFSPDASMFYQGMFTANDLLKRDGGRYPALL